MEKLHALHHRLKESLSCALKKDKALANAPCWIVAVSGGVDSMALLDFLHQTQEFHKKNIIVAHFNHQLRGEDSNEDASWVQAQCQARALHCFVGKGDVRSRAQEKGESIEMAARTLRYQFFTRLAEKVSTKIIILAHHADDQLELILMRLMRGSGPEGISGMASVTASTNDSGLILWRPFLGVKRNEILDYAAAKDIEWREDASNLDLAHERNRVRQVLVPELQRNFGTAVVDGILRSCELIHYEHAFLMEAADQWENSKSVSTDFKKLHKALQRELMRRAMIRIDVTPEFGWIERLRIAEKGSKFCLPTNVSAAVLDQFPLLMECPKEPDLEFVESSIECNLSSFQDGIQFADGCLNWEIKEGDINQFMEYPLGKNFEVFDADAVGALILLRHWRAGDRLRPIGSPGSIKLQDWFINEKIEPQHRRRLVVAQAEDRGIFWVEGMRVSEDFKVTSKTKRLLLWQWNRPTSG